MSDAFTAASNLTPLKLEEGFSSSITFGEYDEIGGKFKQESVLEGHSVIYINDVLSVCCGTIGSAGKVCVKRKADCHTSSHKVRTSEEAIKEGLYLKGGTNDIYLVPCLPKKFLSLAVVTIEKPKW
jgi:hypothetical protein